MEDGIKEEFMERFIYPLGFSEARKAARETLRVGMQVAASLVPEKALEVGKEIALFELTRVLRTILQSRGK